MLKLKISLIVLAVFACATPAMVSLAHASDTSKVVVTTAETGKTVKSAITTVEAPEAIKTVVLKDLGSPQETSLYTIPFRQAMSNEEVSKYRKAFEAIARSIDPDMRVLAEGRKDGGVNFLFLR